MVEVSVKLPDKIRTVFDVRKPVLYRGAYGGRGSGKSMSFAKMAAVKGFLCAEANAGGLIVCAREFQNSIHDSSLAEVKAAIRSEDWLLDKYDIGERYVTTKCGRIDFAFVGMRRSIDSIKSKSKIRLLWVDEGEAVSASSWGKADNTVREPGAEVWVTWNPERKNSPTDLKFRVNPHPDSLIVPLNWRDNPMFPDTLNKKRLHCLETDPDEYAHTWEGEYVVAMAGSYFAKGLAIARQEHRIGHVVKDPLLSLRAFWDIGGTGAKADACSIWIAQFVGKEIRLLDYYEAIGQQLSVHVEWLRKNGYGDAEQYLPHDGVKHDTVFDVSYDSELRRAGFNVTVIRNQGAGAANQRIEAIRRILAQCWFDNKCESGLAALGWYHEKKDDIRNIGLGPEHDWSSHGSDSFGMMAIVAEDVFASQNHNRRPIVKSSGGWMG